MLCTLLANPAASIFPTVRIRSLKLSSVVRNSHYEMAQEQNIRLSVFCTSYFENRSLCCYSASQYLYNLQQQASQ